MMLYVIAVFGFVGLIWALIGLGEAHTGVCRIFRELECDRRIAQPESGPGGILE
ncbi:MAG: hypothetical protein WB676_21850 [Bryobacteraceae bacterium]